jgi:poly-gamma-glutamate synthesis protein (capsule biosynthesis protein)
MKRYLLLVCASLIFNFQFSIFNSAQAQSVKIIFAGDLMGHMPQHNAAKQADGSYDYSPCFRYVKDYIQSADLAILNLEVPLAGKPYSGYPQFSAPDALAACAKEAGFDIMTTANNHCMDRGQKGLERTLQALDSLEIPHLGTYRNRTERDVSQPLIIEVNGFTLALLTYTYGTNGIPVVAPNVVNFIDTAEMARDLRVAREQGAEYVITLIHWGIEYADKANKEQEQTARWLLEHGCDAVIGGHPHVVQNFTLDAIPDNGHYPEIVVYSMGNLVSNQRDVNCDGGIMIELDLQKTFFDTRVTACRYMPYWVHRGTFDGLYQYYIVPSTDAVAYPDSYQISGDQLKALQLFDNNTRKRLEACALKDGRNITERIFYRNTLPIHPKASGVVPLRGNPLLRALLQEKTKNSTNNKNK